MASPGPRRARSPRSAAVLATTAVLAAALFGPAGVRAGGVTVRPIRIARDTDFAACGCVSSGSGTTSDPYVIGPLAISPGSGDGIDIDGTLLTKSFVLYDVTSNGNPGNGITLSNINPSGTQAITAEVLGGATTTNSNGGWGVQVVHSSGVTLDGVGVSTTGPGVANTGFATANQNLVGGIDLESSSHVLVRGWQFNADGGDTSPDWVGLDPSTFGGGGIRLFGVTDSTVDHNAANNSSDGHFMVFDSSGNTISNNTGGYPYTANFMVADGSAYNVLTGNSAWDGDYHGVLIADPLAGTVAGDRILGLYGPTHDNVVTGNYVHSNGPTGGEIKAGIVPSFLGGIVILNGAYGNTISNNQTYASTGTDLGWAQAVPDASSPIGVANYPAMIMCNVTTYDGPGSVAPPLNGNVWTGNTYKVIAPCLPAQ